MSQNPTTLYYERIEYSPDWLKSQQLREKKIFGTKPTLHQIKFTLNDEAYLFPDFNNIFSRSESAKEWWFLSPEDKGESLFQSDKYINEWWGSFQENYSSSILLKRAARCFFVDSLFAVNSNCLVDSLWFKLSCRANRLDVDDENSRFSFSYYYNAFHDFGIGEHWRFWLWKNRTVDYYHTLFAPVLNEKSDNREILRLSNRFPEYALAIDWLDVVREGLYIGRDKKDIDRFFNMQLSNRKNQAKATKKSLGDDRRTPLYFCQCRVCGDVFCCNIHANRKGKSQKICLAPECERAWELLRKKLPPRPNDADGGQILLSHL